MTTQGHCLCDRHQRRYRPRSIEPAWFVASATMDTGLAQFTNQAACWLSPSERQHAIRLTQ